ncbi:hypothetical protein LSH36_207g01010 [Paralvinella palmiformis]|uniref:Dynactin subunit 4 n=1 Tax=Paralvinella palmiformis TaxID=53620 RepID=A0AAD9JQC7_9ANNE|nr:hypothetical protein LSH36_207g01010 [Paralvinella palmiformis]
MATYMDVNRVQYVAFSGTVAPLSKLYFCRHCLKLRSRDCVSQEVDSYYCSNCLENMPSPDAKLKKNRCANCFDCPSCGHSLSTRATSVAFQDPDNPGKSTPKKVYYLACGFCRWTSRDVGLKDQLIASGGWQEQENPNEKRISELLDYYKHLAQKDQTEREKKKYSRRRSYLHLSEKFGLTSHAIKKRSALMGIGGISIKDDDLSVDIEPSLAIDKVEELPDDVFTKPIVLTDVTTIRQRHANPDFQPTHISQLYPRHKTMLIKRSQRCKECEHNLSKPEFNPSSIKFRIQLVALHHVPEFRIMSLPNLQINKEVQLILTLFNPLDTLTHVALLPSPTDELKWDTAKVVLPTCELVLSPRDDTAEFDDTVDQQQNFKDDPSVVVSRKSNKIGFIVKVTPMIADDDVRISFIMKYDYKNMTPALQTEKKQPEITWLQFPVLVNLGKITG